MVIELGRETRDKMRSDRKQESGRTDVRQTERCRQVPAFPLCEIFCGAHIATSHSMVCEESGNICNEALLTLSRYYSGSGNSEENYENLPLG